MYVERVRILTCLIALAGGFVAPGCAEQQVPDAATTDTAVLANDAQLDDLFALSGSGDFEVTRNSYSVGPDIQIETVFAAPKGSHFRSAPTPIVTVGDTNQPLAFPIPRYEGGGEAAGVEHLSLGLPDVRGRCGRECDVRGRTSRDLPPGWADAYPSDPTSSSELAEDETGFLNEALEGLEADDPSACKTTTCASFQASTNLPYWGDARDAAVGVVRITQGKLGEGGQMLVLGIAGVVGGPVVKGTRLLWKGAKFVVKVAQFVEHSGVRKLVRPVAEFMGPVGFAMKVMDVGTAANAALTAQRYVRQAFAGFLRLRMPSLARDKNGLAALVADIESRFPGVKATYRNSGLNGIMEFQYDKSNTKIGGQIEAYLTQLGHWLPAEAISGRQHLMGQATQVLSAAVGLPLDPLGAAKDLGKDKLQDAAAKGAAKAINFALDKLD